MKVNEFIEWLSDFDPESEIKFDLFEEVVDINGNYMERWTELSAEDLNYLYKDLSTHLTLAWLD